MAINYMEVPVSRAAIEPPMRLSNPFTNIAYRADPNTGRVQALTGFPSQYPHVISSRIPRYVEPIDLTPLYTGDDIRRAVAEAMSLRSAAMAGAPRRVVRSTAPKGSDMAPSKKTTTINNQVEHHLHPTMAELLGESWSREEFPPPTLAQAAQTNQTAQAAQNGKLPWWYDWFGPGLLSWAASHIFMTPTQRKAFQSQAFPNMNQNPVVVPQSLNPTGQDPFSPSYGD